MNLFKIGDFTLNSQQASQFKIDCDSLTNDDIHTIAKLISDQCSFREVVGVPTGGNRLESALVKYQNPLSSTILIVDDVLTTGHSMEMTRQRVQGNSGVIGAVMFARGPCPGWVQPVFQMNPRYL